MKNFYQPYFPVVPSFNQDESLNYDYISKYLNFLINKGVKNIMTTAGTTQFDLLNNEEIRNINMYIIENHTDDINNFLIGIPVLSLKDLKKELEFYKNYKKNNLSFLIIFPARHFNEELIFNFYKEVSQFSHLGVYIHGYNFKSYKGGEYQYTNKLINELSNLPNIKGIKEENSNIWNSYNIFKDFEIKKCKDFEIILAGGSQRRHWFLGKEYFTFLSGIGSVFPEIDLNYYQYYQQGLFKNARHIIDNLEDMFFDTFFNIGWHIALRESLKIYDLIKGNKKPFPLDIKSDEKNNILKTLNSIDSIKNKVK